MRTLIIVVASLALVAFLPAPAEAQVFQSMVTITMNAPEGPLTNATSVLTFSGATMYTGDVGTYARMSGIPITYTVTKAPAWATVVVSPASDVIPAPAAPSGLTYTAARSFQVTVVVDPMFVGQAIDQVEVTVTTGASTLGMPATSKTSVPVMADVGEEPCEVADHQALFDAAVEAANAYNAEQADTFDETADVGSSRPSSADPELITQDTGSKPVALPWIAVAGFALVGAGVGLVLRRRFR